MVGVDNLDLVIKFLLKSKNLRRLKIKNITIYGHIIQKLLKKIRKLILISELSIDDLGNSQALQ